MRMHVQIELFGGPEDGREITLPAETERGPLSPLPVPYTRGDTGVDGPVGTEPCEEEAEREIAWYERYYRRDQGWWVYKYANSSTVQPETV